MRCETCGETDEDVVKVNFGAPRTIPGHPDIILEMCPDCRGDK